MSKSMIAIIACMALFSCNGGKQEENQAEVSVKADSVPTAPAVAKTYRFSGKQLLEYEAYLNNLDAADVTMASEARDRFQGLFYDQDPATCDSAYYLFENFYSRVTD